MVKKVKYLFFAIVCMCVTPLITHAECDYQRLAELSRLASNVQLSYTYDGNGFVIYMTNLTSDLYTKDAFENVIYGGNEKQFSYSSGSYNFTIYSNDAACAGEKLLTKSINLPTPNVYALYDECNQYPSFKYCQKWGEFLISEEEFYAELNNYKKDLEATEIEPEGDSSNLSIILDILKNNFYMFVIFGIAILFLVVYRLIKNIKKS